MRGKDVVELDGPCKIKTYCEKTISIFNRTHHPWEREPSYQHPSSKLVPPNTWCVCRAASRHMLSQKEKQMISKSSRINGMVNEPCQVYHREMSVSHLNLLVRYQNSLKRQTLTHGNWSCWTHIWKKKMLKKQNTRDRHLGKMLTESFLDQPTWEPCPVISTLAAQTIVYAHHYSLLYFQSFQLTPAITPTYLLTN